MYSSGGEVGDFNSALDAQIGGDGEKHRSIKTNPERERRAHIYYGIARRSQSYVPNNNSSVRLQISIEETPDARIPLLPIFNSPSSSS
jgi:hypothetical protein